MNLTELCQSVVCILGRFGIVITVQGGLQGSLYTVGLCTVFSGLMCNKEIHLHQTRNAYHLYVKIHHPEKFVETLFPDYLLANYQVSLMLLPGQPFTGLANNSQPITRSGSRILKKRGCGPGLVEGIFPCAGDSGNYLAQKIKNSVNNFFWMFGGSLKGW